MNEFKFLEPSDTYKIYEILTTNKDFSNSYISPYINLSVYTERYIREKMFDYKELYIGEFNKENLENIIIISLPANPPFRLAFADIVYIKNININDKFLEYIANEINAYFPNISKIRINILNNKNIEFINRSFKREYVLEKEINNENVEIFSSFIK